MGQRYKISSADLRHLVDLTFHLKIKDYCESHESLAGSVCSVSGFWFLQPLTARTESVQGHPRFALWIL